VDKGVNIEHSTSNVELRTPRVVFEDEYLLVVDKPGHMVCHSASRPEHPTLVGWVREHGVTVPRLLNRLDRETSGLVVIAKTERAAKNLSNSLQCGEITKQYVAICWGEFKEERGVVDKPIGLAGNSPVYTKRGVDETSGRSSMTEFVVETKLRGFTVVRLTPKTGRTHQLRVHTASIGHPIVGDKIYGPDDKWYLEFIKNGVTGEMLKELLLSRQALHAGFVRLRHPRTQEFQEFRAPLPEDMVEFVSRVEDGRGCT
jgi:23S rRNA pseudouridine1911/1915/1917 synthase